MNCCQSRAGGCDIGKIHGQSLHRGVLHQSRDEKRCGRNAVRGIYSRATRARYGDRTRQGDLPNRFPIKSHFVSIDLVNMLAITNYGGLKSDRGRFRAGSTTGLPSGRKRAALWLCLHLLGSVGVSEAQTNVAPGTPGIAAPDFAARAQKFFLAARDRLRLEPTQAEPGWQFGRAAFDWAEFATNDTQRAAIAEEGIVACRQLTARFPELGPGHYYLAMNLGQLARTKLLGALRIVEEMEREFKRAAALDATFDYAGADRSLGLLYFDAPGWPTSIGSRSKARLHLERAVALSPDFPDNRLSLVEAFLKWRDKEGVQKQMRQLEELLPQARRKLVGEPWDASWPDWNQRWQKIREKTGGTTPAKK